MTTFMVFFDFSAFLAKYNNVKYDYYCISFVSCQSFRWSTFRSVVIIYKEKEPCKSAVKHSYKALMFTYRKELTPFMQRKKVQYFCIKPLLFL